MDGSIAIIGARGFVGRHLVRETKRALRLFGRETSTLEGHQVHGWSRETNLEGCSAVIHLAAAASTRGTHDYQATNVRLPLQVLESSAKASIKRFVFVSSIFVHGRSAPQPLSPTSELAPDDAYARSKADAEHALELRAKALGMELVIVRPPLVYGAGATSSFAMLRKLIALHAPLPFGRARSKRSIIAVENLCAALLHLANSNAPPARFLPADSDDLTLEELISTIASAAGQRAINLPVPRRAMRAGLELLGRSHIYEQLFCELRIDRTHWQTSEWAPPLATADAMRRAVV